MQLFGRERRPSFYHDVDPAPPVEPPRLEQDTISKAQVRRTLEIVATVSVLMLIMFGGLALRAALALSQGVH